MATDMLVSESIATDGYAVVRGYDPEASSISAFERFGQVDTVEGLNLVQTLVPHDLADSPPNTYSGNFGTSDFPLHTDLAHWAVPPRYLALRCQRGSSAVATRLYDSSSLVKNLRPEVLRMALVQPRRPMRNGKHLLRLLDRTDSGDSFRVRWDSLYLKPATTIAKEVFMQMQSYLLQVETLDVVLLNRGDMLIIDNWRCLHGRSSTPESARTRHIDRAYLGSIV